MKRISSFILAFIISITCIFSAGISYADNRPHIEDALNNLQTQAGYIPFQNSSVQYNCFGFISDVCARLYSVTYYYEQQVGNYRFNHTSNYFTVSQATFPDSSYAKALKEWLCANAAVGDVLQIGCANDNDSKKHTVLIQHIDDEKIMLYHSNYATSGISSSVCRIDTVYWKSFIANPTSNKSNSLNLLLGSNFRRTGGVGMSLNRYSFLEQYYQLDSLTKYTSEITKTERDSSTSVKIYFKQIPDATAYSVQYRASDSNKWITASNNITALNYSVKNLTTGAAYCFRVRAFANGKWQDYSTEATKTVQPPKPAKISAAANNNAITLTWAQRKDISGVTIYRSTSKSGNYEQLTNVPQESGATFTDTNIANNQKYYYKIQRYINVKSETYQSEISPSASAEYELGEVTNLKVNCDTKSTLKVSWSGAQNAQSYTIGYAKAGTNNYKYIVTTDTKYTLRGLKLGSKYVVAVCANNNIGSTAATVSSPIKVKLKKTKLKASKKGKKAKLSWSKVNTASGYKIYRATSKNGKYKLIKTVKGNKTFKYYDKKVYKKTRYYYYVKAYATKNKKQYYSDNSAKKSVKI